MTDPSSDNPGTSNDTGTTPVVLASPAPSPEPVQAETRLVCANHPDRETSLRCNRCGKPICPKCMVLTPVGYRCKECVSNQQKVYDNALPQDYVIGAVLAALISFAGSLLVPVAGFFTILLAPGVGTGIAEIVRRVTSRRRSKRLFQVIAGAAALGGLLPAVLVLLLTGIDLVIVWYGLYLFFVTSTVFYRLGGIQI